MSKGLLDAFQDLTCNFPEDYVESYNKVLDGLKALEILKNKEVNVHALFLHLKRFDSPDGYNVLVGTKYQITQEEYELLKEVLKDE